MQCPSCGTESSGAFCAECGTRLGPSRCPSCDAPAAAGARFCTGCGTALEGGGRRGAAHVLPWVAAGVALIALAGVLLWQRGGDDTPGSTVPGGAVPMGAAPFADGASDGSPPPLTGTPREQADRLFNRVMQAAEQGDTAGARRFTPMTIDAYRMSEPLDDDGRFHLALVQVIAGDPAAAMSTANEILAEHPDHLLALIAAAQASEAAADPERAREYYRHFLRVYDTEAKKPLPEYQDHAGVLPTYREQAAKRVGG